MLSNGEVKVYREALRTVPSCIIDILRRINSGIGLFRSVSIDLQSIREETVSRPVLTSPYRHISCVSHSQQDNMKVGRPFAP